MIKRLYTAIKDLIESIDRRRKDEKKLSRLLKRLQAVTEALIKSIEISEMDIQYCGANLKTKERRKTFMNCINKIPEYLNDKLDEAADFPSLKVSNEWSKIGKYKTKSFDDVDFSEIAEGLGVDIEYNKQLINLFFDGGDINQKIIDTCLYTVNNYFEINNSVKKSIIAAFKENKTLQEFFEYCYENFPRYESSRIFVIEDFKMINLESVVGSFKFPNITFFVDKNNNLTISLLYHFDTASFPVKAHALLVTMNEQFDILKFEHAEHLIS